MLWGHPDFMTTARTDGAWVAHGHTVVPVAEAGADARGRSAVDTGALLHEPSGDRIDYAQRSRHAGSDLTVCVCVSVREGG